MRYLAALAKVESQEIPPTAFLADEEIAREPLHLTLVGAKDDPTARALYAGARTVVSTYRLLEWLDRREGPLPHPVPPFPILTKPAVYLCTANSCSLPIFTEERLARAAAAQLAPHGN